MSNSVNPREIYDLPLIVFSNHTSGFIEWAIKWRTKGYYNHVMMMCRKGMFASQGNTYSEVPVDRYMKRGSELKFVKIVGLTYVQRSLICASVRKKLKLPWHKKMYDWIGIFGQAIGIKRINVNGLNYCSEDVVIHITSVLEYLNDEDLEEAISLIPRHGSPEDLNEHFKKYPHIFEVYGKWDSDEESL